MSLLTVTPIQTGLNFSVWALVCFIFNYLIRRRASAWWGKYTMTMSAALDSGLAFALVVVFFGFIYPGWMDGFRWWGTEVYKQVRLINYSFYSRSIVDAWRVGLRLASMSLQTLGAWGAFWTTIITDSYMNHTQINILNLRGTTNESIPTSFQPRRCYPTTPKGVLPIITTYLVAIALTPCEFPTSEAPRSSLGP
jgi:hypothetical protein